MLAVALTTEPLVPVPAAPEGHRYEHLTVERVAGGCGAVLGGVDLAADLDDAVIAEIRRAVLDHHVVFFRDQSLSPDQQVAFSRRFGPFSPVPFIEPRSATMNPFPEGRISAWRRDARGSAMTTVESGERPISDGSSPSGIRRPSGRTSDPTRQSKEGGALFIDSREGGRRPTLRAGGS